MNSTRELLGRLRRANSDIGALVERLGSSPTSAEYLEAPAQIGRLQAEFDEANNALSHQLGITSAKDRILHYLRAHVGEVVTKEEIAGVAGIFEFPRRVRELRRDAGWLISSMESHPQLRPGDYRLLSLERDPSTTSQWDVAREIRVSHQSPADKIMALLQALGGRADIELARLALGPHDLELAVRSAREAGAPVTISRDAVEVGR